MNLVAEVIEGLDLTARIGYLSTVSQHAGFVCDESAMACSLDDEDE